MNGLLFNSDIKGDLAEKISQFFEMRELLLCLSRGGKETPARNRF
jgi:hypothetical protein